VGVAKLAGEKEIKRLGVSQGYANYIGVAVRDLAQRRISSRNDVLLVAGQIN
jgi:hypothetical protein